MSKKKSPLKSVGRIITLVGIVLLIGYIVSGTRAYWEYETDIYSYWSLSDKASTIEKKSEYMDQYVGALEDAHLSGHNAAIFRTPDNSYEQNFIALQTLQQRLHDILHMDINSFEYQKAMEQITEQEQGDAFDMTHTFTGIWYKKHHPMLWSWWCICGVIGNLLLIIIGGVMWSEL